MLVTVWFLAWISTPRYWPNAADASHRIRPWICAPLRERVSKVCAYPHAARAHSRLRAHRAPHAEVS